MKYYKLNDLCTDIVDCPHTTPDWKNEGIRVVRNFNLKDGNLDFADGYFVDEATYLERTKRAIPEEGDIIISREAPMGVVGIVPKGLKCCLGQRLVLLKVNTGKCAPYYLLNTLMSDFVQTQFKRADATGSIVSNLCIPDLKEIIIPVIESGQKDVARLLEIINKKQLINNAINDNLEQQIKTIFTFQFLQNANTEWKQQSLAELSEMYQPKTISGKDLIADGNYFVYGANGIIGKYNQYNHSESEIAVACRGASCGSIQMTLPFSWITGNAMVVKPHSDFPYREYLYYYLLAKNPNYLCSGSAQPQLTRENLTLYSLKVPSTTELNAFESYAGKVRKIIIKNQQENIELSTLRDWLLPMLMNGQATISDCCGKLSFNI